MKTTSWTIGVLLAVAMVAQGATNDLTSTLQRGLFEEEANRNLEAAIQAYQSVASRFDQDRRLAATAIYRLGECYRKQGNTNDATAQFQRVVREFSDQSALATLSWQNLAAFGIPARVAAATPAEASPPKTDASELTSSEAEEVKRIRALIKDSPDLINAADEQTGMTPLHRAARAGQLVVAQFLLDNGADTEAKDQQYHGRTPLHYAAAAGHKAMVELLLSKQANVQAADRDGLTPLHLAAEGGYRSVAESLLAHKAPVDANNKDGSTPLLLAADHGFRSVMELLLAHGADINAATTNIRRLRGTALTIAVQRGDQNLVAFLLGKGAALDALNSDGRTPLSYAVEGRQASLVKLLLHAHANPNAGGEDLPLALAAWFGDQDSLKLLLAHGADPNTNCLAALDIRTYGGIFSQGATCTPLFLAVTQHHPEVVKELIQAKADPNGLGPDGSPLVFDGLYDPPTLQALLEGGADPNRPGQGEERPLHLALNMNRAKAVELLLAHGADPNATTKGLTPLDSAVWSGDPAVVQLLLKKGADVNAKGGTDGRTPLFEAVERGKPEVVKVLLENGADPNARNNSGATPLDLTKNRSGVPGTPMSMRMNFAPQPPGYPGGAPSVAFGTSAPGGSPGAAASSTPVASIPELLRQHGALDDLPRLDAIEVRRPSTHYSSTISNQGGTAANQVTLVEALGIQYKLLLPTPDEGPHSGPSYRMLAESRFRESLPYPDLAHIRIRKPAADLKSWQERTVDLSAMLETGVCSNDVALSWGEVVEVPERDHSLGESWSGFTPAQLENLIKCLQRQVEIVIKGQPIKATLGPEVEEVSPYGARWSVGGMMYKMVNIGTLWLKPALLGTKLVLASSDLSRVKVIRKDPATGQQREWLFDCTESKPQPMFWLRAGDVIEVPERQDGLSSETPPSRALEGGRARWRLQARRESELNGAQPAPPIPPQPRTNFPAPPAPVSPPAQP